MKTKNILFNVIAIIWLFWGLSHVLAGLASLKLINAGGVNGMFATLPTDIEKPTLDIAYPAIVTALIEQQVWSLFWIGLLVCCGAILIFRKMYIAIALNTILALFTDIGYLMFLQFKGLLLPPGPLKLIFSGLAILITAILFVIAIFSR